MYELMENFGKLFLAKKYPAGNVGIVAQFQGTPEQVRMAAQEITDILNSRITRVDGIAPPTPYTFNPTGELKP